MNQPTLPFGQSHTRSTDPATSRKAADGFAERGNFKGHMKLIYEYVVEHPNCIPPEIAEGTGLQVHQVNRRQSDLKRRDLVRVSDVERGGFYEWRAT